MSHRLINALRQTLSESLDLRKSRLESFCTLVVGLILARSVNLSHLAVHFANRAQIASNYRRLQRFLEQTRLDGGTIAGLVVALAGKSKGPWLLALDRTNWKFGRYEINFLMLALVRGRCALPLFWQVLDKQGASSARERKDFIAALRRIFPDQPVKALLADREFLGREWLKALQDHKIPFVVRLRDNTHIRLESGHSKPMRYFFAGLRKGQCRYLARPHAIGCHDRPDNPRLALAATRLASGEILIVATDLKPRHALALYRKRWRIETLFADLKSRGFNLEDTHITHPRRIEKLLAAIALAYAWVVTLARRELGAKPIPTKTHQRPAKSIFRYGFDQFRKRANLNSNTFLHPVITALHGIKPLKAP